MTGLGAEVGKRFRANNQDSYEQFCADLIEWRREHGVAPQEADAILTEIMRRSRAEDAPAPAEDPLAPVEERPTSDDVAAACHLPVEQVDAWAEALEKGMRQAVFFGPPGTGKTHIARHLARHLATSPDHVEITQFHPAYSYEDFVEGLRPERGDGGTLHYAVRKGVFSKLCARASEVPTETFVLVIDEMNRADWRSTSSG